MSLPEPQPVGSTDRPSDLSADLEALLFLAPSPVSVGELADACETDEAEVETALSELERRLGDSGRGVVLRRVAGGVALASAPDSEDAARRLLARPRTPPLTKAQAETLAIVAYLQPVSRPEIARIRGVSSESAVASLGERGLIEESGKSRFGAVLYRTSELFERLFGLESLDPLPDPAQFDPDPADERALRVRLLSFGERRGGS
ncbi:MAG: SMC-Scp complex subunit ScpB, partial [Solirubrobacterales bacterium]